MPILTIETGVSSSNAGEKFLLSKNAKIKRLEHLCDTKVVCVICPVLVCWFSDRLKHPNIVQLLETYEDKSKVYLVMEL